MTGKDFDLNYGSISTGAMASKYHNTWIILGGLQLYNELLIFVKGRYGQFTAIKLEYILFSLTVK